MGSAVMFSVFLADSDQRVLRAIKRKIPWRELGFKVIGSCADPDMAVKEIIRRRPDVVVFDTKPLNTGLAGFMDAIRGAGVQCEFVMLTESWSIRSVRNFLLIHGGSDYLIKSNDTREIERRLGALYDEMSASALTINHS